MIAPVAAGPAARAEPRPGAKPKPDPKVAEVARQFEALFVGQMLKSARAAALADDPLTGEAGSTFVDVADQLRAQSLAAQAPLGVARLLAK